MEEKAMEPRKSHFNEAMLQQERTLSELLELVNILENRLSAFLPYADDPRMVTSASVEPGTEACSEAVRHLQANTDTLRMAIRRIVALNENLEV